MIETTNKNISGKDSNTTPVYDSASKVLKIKNNLFGKVEANPFEPNALLERYVFKRGNFQTVIASKTFEYDFTETNRIMDTESFVARIFAKKKGMLTRTEPFLKSSSTRNADYIQKRLSEMEYVSDTLFSEFFKTVVESLVNYNNAFILIHRKDFSSSGLSYNGKDPMAALFVLSPTRLKPVENDQKDIIGYAYYSKPKTQAPIFIDKDDVYHIHKDKKIDVSVGTPLLESVRDDILSLRQIEESIERLIYKNASPLLHAKVGTDAYPAGKLADGTTEIDYYTDLIQNMEDEGGLTTSHRVDVRLLGAESQAIRVKEYVEYFKLRVLSGLKASLLDIGEAHSISTAGAEAVSQTLKEDVEDYKAILEDFFTNRLFTDILLEANWYNDKIRVPKEEKVQFKIPVVDMDNKIKLESHLANLVRNGLMSIEDFCKETGRPIPKITFTQENNSGSISNSTGAFSAITLPQNQHTEKTAIDVEYEVLDEIVGSEKERLLSKLYYYVNDSLEEVIEDKAILEELSFDLYEIVSKYKSLGIGTRAISKSILLTLQTGVIETLSTTKEGKDEQ